MRASEIRSISRTPAANSFFGIGSPPASGIPGAPFGPAFCSTSTESSETSSAGLSIRAARSLLELKTTAWPRCRSRCRDTADCLITAPSGARLPRRIAMPPCCCSGCSSEKTMRSGPLHPLPLAALSPRPGTPASCSPMVRPLMVGSDRCSSPPRASSFMTAGTPPASNSCSM